MIRFLTSGEVVIESSLLQQRLTDFVEVVVSRLAETEIQDTQLQVEWAAIQSTEPQEAAFCLTSARLGLDPYSEAEKYEADILRAADQLDDQLLDDFMDVVQPDKISVALEWVAAAQEDIRRLTAPAADQVEALRSELSPSPDWSHLRPWERGWAQARRVRGTLGIDAADPFELQGILRASARAVPPRGLQALGGKDPDTPALVIVGNHQPEAARRFTIARALWHLLWQSESRFLVTTAYTDLQKVERAFAAELLAPAEGIAGQLSVESIHLGAEEREIEELARKYQVSPMIVQHQLDNQILR
ncbi:ImmA/IrrE family metallo-endopeptidase [Micromonospora sp. BQ11]|uniref:ImmA/IrrE family metallo-endopeptidase n=1 Tax=Micromonospora sp. BQ11 TaxID=3452212 RepID=UPI003F88A5E9